VLWALRFAALAWRCFPVFAMHSPVDRTYLPTDARFDSMLFGCAQAVYGNPALDLTPGDRPSARDGTLFGLGLVGLIATFLIRNDAMRETVRNSIQGLCLHPLSWLRSATPLGCRSGS
jgi:hypothetical protein